MYGKRLETWDKAMEWPLTAAALLFFIAYGFEITADLRGTDGLIAEIVIVVTWLVFLVDYVVRLVITENRWRWFYRHLLDLAIVVLPMLRPLRLMRFLTVIAILQRGAGSKLRGRVVIYTVGATALIIVIAALAVLDAEQSTGNITDFGDALWWAFVTVTTVGYGDFFPVTLMGRLIAVGLMISGIALIGVVTATLASWIVERVTDVTEEAEAKDAEREAARESATQAQVDALRREIGELKDLVRELQPSR